MGRKITKKEAADILGKSERAVERLVGQNRLTLYPDPQPGRTRAVPMYDEDEVRALLRPGVQPALAPSTSTMATSPDTNPDNNDARSEVRSMLASGVPFWVSYEDAMRRTGAARSWIQAGVWARRIATLGGRVALLDVASFVTSPALPGYLEAWRERERKEQPKQLKA
jgi:uncharacterized protein (DUF2126 family)